MSDLLDGIGIFVGCVLIGWIPGAIGFVILSPFLWLMGIFG
jgi:hypothetical protein